MSANDASFEELLNALHDVVYITHNAQSHDGGRLPLRRVVENAERSAIQTTQKGRVR